MTIWNTCQGHNDRVRVGQSKRIWGAGLARDLGGRAAEIISFEHFLEGLKGCWWPDIGWQAIPDQRCSGVKCKRAKFSFGGWLYQEIWAGRTKLSSWFVVALQRGQIRWCACAENFVCESSYFELDPRYHWKPVKFIEQWSGTAETIHIILVHDVQPDSRDLDAIWRPKVVRSIIFPTTTLGDYDTAVVPDPASVDAIGPAGGQDGWVHLHASRRHDLNLLEMATN